MKAVGEVYYTLEGNYFVNFLESLMENLVEGLVEILGGSLAKGRAESLMFLKALVKILLKSWRSP